MFLKNLQNNKCIFVSLPNKKQKIFVGKDLSNWAIEELLKKNMPVLLFFVM